MTHRSKFIEKVFEKYLQEYKKLLNVDKYKNDKNIGNGIENHNGKLSIMSRFINNIELLKFTYLFEKTQTICTTFKATRDGTTSIYTYLYSKINTNGKIEHQFYCVGPTFKSQDGEYRKGFLPFSHFEKLRKKFGDIYEVVENMILRHMESGELELRSDIFYPHKFSGSPAKFEENINNSRFAIYFYATAWIQDYYNIHNKIIENHVNPSYIAVLYNKNDEPVYKKIFELVGGDYLSYNRLIKNIQHHTTEIDLDKKSFIWPLSSGQKLFPMTINEIINIHDINYPVWRELYIGIKCSNLVANLISPSFPFINDWLFIQNVHPGFYDNLTQYTKYEHSKIADEISSQIRELNKKNYSVYEPNSKIPINNKFNRLSSKMMGSVNYAESNIILTDTALLVHSEHMDRTIKDLPLRIIHETSNIGKIGLIMSSINIFTKHLFEFIYGFYCMNTKLKIFHGDLHGNNATIYKLFSSEYICHKANDPKILYILGEKEQYIFDHYGMYSSIIDFSRAFLGGRENLVREYGETYAEIYFKNQRNRILSMLNHYFPNFVAKNKDILMSRLLEEFDIIFKILTAVDTYSITNAFSIIFKDTELNVSDDIIAFNNKVLKHAESLIMDNLHKVISGKLKSVEWPNLEIIRENFGKYRVKRPIVGDVIDIYNYENNVHYSMDKYETYPEILKIVHKNEIRQELNMPSDPYIDKWLRYKSRDFSGQLEMIINEYKRENFVQESSWMYE